MIKKINIVWFKRDLRITDHLPLHNASIEKIPFIPLYVIDNEYWSQDYISVRHWNFVYDCLEELNTELSKIGQPLIVKKGLAIDIFKKISQSFKIQKVFVVAT